MIITRTPLRASFAGGGSDIASFYRRFGGAVVSTAIDKYIYVTVNRKFDDGLRVAYSRNEEVENLGQIRHPIVKNALKILGISGGVEITTIADVPSRGTGLGSSSSFAVGLLCALGGFQGRFMAAQELAELSCEVEIELCGEPIGKQDQYAAAYGGMSLIEFNADDTTRVTPIIMPKERRQAVESRLLMFYTGSTRSASALLEVQSEAVSSNLAKQNVLRSMVQLAYQLRDELQSGAVDNLGAILHENWMLKKSISSGISNPEIDYLYDRAIAAGATGGKILGAGGGGFLLFDGPAEKHLAIEAALVPLRRVPVGFERQGCQVIFYHA
ncbi:GHMP kinase [Tardiphaga sp. vice304]|uniref:GHMP family kinase ATP-binding protein n=1 Tax=Tardiphaga sp. vice304 TaxID=2592817 RepID=UPI00116388F6|nr:GHMP kinase [Tardiphaga sp. vice304]QDM28174.1 GHMP kinase [Tardiphaga sp. vice304]